MADNSIDKSDEIVEFKQLNKTLGAGSLFGEVALTTETPYPSTATTLG